MNKNVKMTTENYNKIIEMLDKIQVSSGIQNAQYFLSVVQLLKNIEILDEIKDDKNDK